MELIVATIFDEITAALARGERVELRGFGAFTVKHRNARTGRNPRTGEAVPVDEKAVPFFKAGKELRERVNQGTAGPTVPLNGARRLDMLRLIIGASAVLLLVLFALSNAEPVRIGLWPTDYSLETPLSIAVLAGAAIAFLLGGLLVWITSLASAGGPAARRTVRVLEEQVEELRAQLPRPLAPPS